MFRHLIALVATIAFATLAQASCGDWLAHPVDTTQADDPGPMPSLLADHFGSSSLPLSPGPCNGPGCKQAPMAPAPSPLAVETTTEAKWLVELAEEHETSKREGQRRPVEDRVLLAEGADQDLERPPRTS